MTVYVCVPLLLLLALAANAFRQPVIGIRTPPQLVRESLRMTSTITPTPARDDKLKFGLGNFAFSLLPLSPEAVGRRKTLFTEIVKDTVWTLDQVQGIINVNVPVRCTIIKLEEGGLFINNPVAPTKECIEMVKNLESEHGPVKYITLSSLALEHKGTAGAFSANFPKSSVYVQSGQYAFPLDLPTQLFFPFGKTVKTIPQNSADAPWGNEIDHKCLGVLKPKGVGGFAETAYFHRATKTLLVTDAVVKVEDEAPAILQEDPRALLYHARDDMLEFVTDTPSNRRKGWRRMLLFGLTFQPEGIDIKDTFAAAKMLDKVAPEMKALGDGAIPYDGGFYPWEWIKDEQPNFKALQGGLLVAPILQKLILNREPERVMEWVDAVAEWPFQRIIPAHLSNNVKAGPKDFKAAFDFLFEPKSSNNVPAFLAPILGQSNTRGAQPLQADVQFLDDVSKQLTEANVLFEEAPKLKR
mmetsp:Transcript_30783/g.51501  ORF Transcript_30783/g.51501 Transcript_30783/m.51501 type:complete len:469 (-) Transcript_30783:117-1523(-)